MVTEAKPDFDLWQKKDSERKQRNRLVHTSSFSGQPPVDQKLQAAVDEQEIQQKKIKFEKDDKIKKNKSDGQTNHNSNHFIYAPQSITIHNSQLINSMF